MFKPSNDALLINKFHISPTLKEFRQALALRNRRLILKKMLDQEDAEREAIRIDREWNKPKDCAYDQIAHEEV